MENYSYYTFHNVPCILIEREDRISLIPCKEDDFKNPFNYMQDTNFTIDYTNEIYKYKHAYIRKLTYNFGSIDLYPDYIIHSISPEICAIEITGPAVDDFFSPSTYFYYKYYKGKKDFGNIVYNDDIADKWVLKYNNSELTITLYYGNVLRRGIASDLMLHPKLRVEFGATTDTMYVYQVYCSIKRFFSFILYKSECGKYDVELFSMINEKFSSIGQMFDTNLADAKYDKQVGRICYSDYKKYVPSLLQFVFDDPTVYLKHLPKYGIRDWEREDIELLYTQLFTAFESECQKNKKEFNTTDTSLIKNIKNELIYIIDGIANIENNYTDDEKQFIADAKQRIQQLGTQFGQKKKIINAYNILSSSIESLIPDILYRIGEYRSSTQLTEKQINDIAKRLTALRGSIVHGGEHKPISLENCQLINFLEVIIYAQMLYRANIMLPDIKMILGSTLFHKHDLFNKSINELKETES